MAGYIGGKAVNLSTSGADISGTANLDIVDIDGAVNMATTALVTGVLTANGGAVFNEGSADVDFRVESNGDANMLFVDGGNNRVGVGTNAPTDTLNVQAAAAGTAITLVESSDSGSNPAAFIGYRSRGTDLSGHTAIQANNTMTQFSAGAHDGSAFAVGSKIISTASQTWTTSAHGTRLGIFTTPDGSTTPAERMRIDSSGNVGIGTSSPSSLLHLEDDTPIITLRDTSAYSAGTGPYIQFQGLDSGSTNRVFGQIYGLSNGSNSGELAFYTRNSGSTAERMRIDSSGNVGIGTDSPDRKLHIQTADNIIALIESTDADAWLSFQDNTSSSNNAVRVGATGDALRFYAGSAERMRLDSSGRLLIRKTSAVTSGSCIEMERDMSSGVAMEINNTASSGTQNAIHFRSEGGVVGKITISTSATGYVTSSDYRLKTDVQPMTGASARVQALKPVNFEWLSDGTRVDGFLAHEAQAVVPEAVTGTKDAMRDEEYQVSAATGDIYTPATDEAEEVIHSADVEQPETLEDGQQWRETTAAVMGTRSVPDMQGIDQSKMVPLLVAALQEALSRITALENA